MQYKKITKNGLREIGKRSGLKGKKLCAYVDFFSKRFPNQFNKVYAGEWAGRFFGNRTISSADSESKRVLTLTAKKCGCTVKQVNVRGYLKDIWNCK